MNKHTLEINVPEGHEIEEDGQPMKHYEYWKGAHYDEDNYKVFNVVQIKALEDALYIIDHADYVELDPIWYMKLEALRKLTRG